MNLPEGREGFILRNIVLHFYRIKNTFICFALNYLCYICILLTLLRFKQTTMKKQEGYDLSENIEKTQFKFKSIGKNGTIDKLIEFSFYQENIWNLGFGDIKGDDWDDNVISNNNDMRKILQTVANAVHTFLEHYPERKIFIAPLDKQRKILYNRIFQQKWKEIEPLFSVKGIRFMDGKQVFEDYKPTILFDYFIISLN